MLKVLISGSSGLIGKKLSFFLESTPEYEVWKLVRMETKKPNEITWHPSKGFIDSKKMAEIEFDIIIHLSGENVFGIWTENKKNEILKSRVESTKLIVETIRNLSHKPSLFICASGISFYGSDTGSMIADENSPQGSGFLAQVSREWEQSTVPLINDGIRVVNMRLGVVLDLTGGFMSMVVPVFNFYGGGVLGDGTQYFPWITLEDVVYAIEFIIKNNQLNGPINFVSPNLVNNYEFTKTLGSVLNRPTFMWVPKFLFKISYFLFGDFVYEAILSSVRATPTKLIQSGFKFKDPQLETALKRML